jgi:hypothetical protein
MQAFAFEPSVPMSLRKPEHRFFRRRRYRDAEFVHADLSRQTEAPRLEKLRRLLFSTDPAHASERTVRRHRRVRRFLALVFLCLLLWFALESALLWDVFSGDAGVSAPRAPNP